MKRRKSKEVLAKRKGKNGVEAKVKKLQSKVRVRERAHI